MPKASKIKYYAVRIGREGPKIYKSWDECNSSVSRYPGASHRSFSSEQQALDWISSSSSSYSTARNGPSNGSISHPRTSPFDGSDSDIEFLEPPPVASSSKATSRYTTSYDSDIEIIEDPNCNFAPSPGPSPPDEKLEVVLSPEQESVLQKVKAGRNVFFTGSAGTGKSVLLREIIQACQGPEESLAITASTGIAAVNIGGVTLHSWAGIGLGQETAKNFAGKFLAQPKFKRVLDRWRRVKTLIIDEISMIDGSLFDKLEYIARTTRRSDKPFGGIQLVLSGDFCQLPPVPGRQNGVFVPPTFAFDAQEWNKCVGPPVTLTKVFRQKDQAFVNMLNAMRFGELDRPTLEAFQKLSRPVTYNDGIEPTELYSLRVEVETANNSRLMQLTGETHTYEAMDTPGIDSKGEALTRAQMERQLERLIVQKMITLKVGAQVMLVKNLEQGHLVNGSVGSIVGFSTSADAMKLGTQIGRMNPEQTTPVANDPKILGLPEGRVWPMVRFTNGRTILCIPHEFTVNNSYGGMEARRDQIPLILAWALSVHKSQGQTLERVKVDLHKTFEKGQAYVALSRATKMEHLQVLNFDSSKVVAHPRVLAWHRTFDKTVPADDSIPDFDDDDIEFENELEMDDQDLAAYHNFH